MLTRHVLYFHLHVNTFTYTSCFGALSWFLLVTRHLPWISAKPFTVEAGCSVAWTILFKRSEVCVSSNKLSLFDALSVWLTSILSVRHWCRKCLFTLISMTRCCASFCPWNEVFRFNSRLFTHGGKNANVWQIHTFVDLYKVAQDCVAGIPGQSTSELESGRNFSTRPEPDPCCPKPDPNPTREIKTRFWPENF